MTWTKKMAGVILAGALVIGGGLTALAESPENTAQAPAAAARARQLGKQQRQSVRSLRDQIKDLHERISAEGQDLKSHLQTIKEMVQALKQDRDKNRNALEKARVDIREVRLAAGDIKAVDEQLQDARAELKSAIEAKDAPAALGTAQRIVSLMQTKLDLMKAANNKAVQAIAHLKGAAEGQH
jgi:chromosome segregation ATPase